MAALTLPVPSPEFSTALVQALNREIGAITRTVDRALAHVHLTTCWHEDESGECRALATVHQLGTDFSYCEYHFRKEVARG